MSTFADLGLSPVALKSVADLGYALPTPVQEQAIPLVLEGRDIIAAAKTGTGKTAAFSLPALDRLSKGAQPKKPRMLVITPTRELAAQIAEVCTTIGAHTGHRLASVVGGVSLDPQIQKLARSVDVLIATPGRLIDLMNQRAVELGAVEILVLDEADRMLDMGFLPSVTKIVDATPQSRQTLLFSATVDGSIRKQVDTMLRNPALVQIATKGETADTVEQYITEVPHTLKPALLAALLRERGAKRVIVFARTRHRADAACRKLKRAGFVAEAIHSDRSQNQRKRALDNFASGVTDILVATDVLARGIDVTDVAYVVNYDLPTQAEDYVHRIGRTGRAGAEGFAVSFVSPENADELKAIEKFIKKSIPTMTVEGFNLEEAAAEAAERATRATAKRDPELAQAARELAKKKRRKERAKERAAEERHAAEGERGQRKRAKATHADGAHAGTTGARATGAAFAGGKKPANAAAGSGRGRTGGKKQRSSAAHGPSAATTKKPRTSSSANGSTAASRKAPSASRGNAPRSHAKPGVDMRPGRAHRAAVANQRNKRRKG